MLSKTKEANKWKRNTYITFRVINNTPESNAQTWERTLKTKSSLSSGKQKALLNTRGMSQGSEFKGNSPHKTTKLKLLRDKMPAVVLLLVFILVLDADSGITVDRFSPKYQTRVHADSCKLLVPPQLFDGLKLYDNVFVGKQIFVHLALW